MVGKRRQGTKPPSRTQRPRDEEQGANSSIPSDIPVETSVDQSGSSPDIASTVTSAQSDQTASPVTDSPARAANALEALIEAERTELMYVHSILRMLYDVLLYSDDDDAAMHADVAHVCSMLIRESNERLDVLVRRYKAGEFRPTASKQTDVEGAQRPAEGE